jgi:hypothetical protein
MRKTIYIVSFFALVISVSFGIYSFLNAGKLKGEFMSSVHIAGENEYGYLWILTKDSISFTASDEREGNFSTTTIDLFGKTRLYLYDPAGRKILKSITTPFKKLPRRIRMYMINGKLWQFFIPYIDVNADIRLLDPQTGEAVSGLAEIREKYPELQSGINDMYLDEKHLCANISTKDGRNLVFDPVKEKIFDDQNKFNEARSEPGKVNTVFKLATTKDNEEERKNLFLVTGTDIDEDNPSGYLFLADYHANYRHSKDLTVKPLLANKVFLSGFIVCQDTDCCLLFYQSQIGKNADRLLTCVDKNGNSMWTLSTENGLFASLKLNEKNDLSDMTFIKSDIHAYRSGDLVVFECERNGIIGISYRTGKILFSL